MSSEPVAVPVLLVDDDYSKRFALTRLLAPLGYDLVEADSGPAALRCVLAQDFAVILLDVRMPGMDGFETAAMIRTRAHSARTPIVLSTASTSAEIVASGLYGTNVNDFMLAPTEPNQLRAMVSMFGNLYLRTRELTARVEELQAPADRRRLLSDATSVGPEPVS